MAWNGIVFAGTLGEINIAASGAIAILFPLLAQIDLTLFGEFGLGALSFDLNLQLQAALQASLDINLSISNPILNFQKILADIELLISDIENAILGLIPVISIDANLQLSFLANFAASINLQLGGLELLLQLALAVKIPAVTFAAEISAAISAGPLFVLAFDSEPAGTDITLSEVGTQIASSFATGLDFGPNHIDSTDPVFGLVLVTKAPFVWNALAVLMLTS